MIVDILDYPLIFFLHLLIKLYNIQQNRPFSFKLLVYVVDLNQIGLNWQNVDTEHH